MTGALHMGHALNGSIQDMLDPLAPHAGFERLWQPGYDHAGIATQNASRSSSRARARRGRSSGARRSSRASGSSWRDGRTIMSQFRRLGASLDYGASGSRWTTPTSGGDALLRPPWTAGWIYQANRIVNWCPFHETAISDLEVEHAESTTR